MACFKSCRCDVKCQLYKLSCTSPACSSLWFTHRATPTLPVPLSLSESLCVRSSSLSTQSPCSWCGAASEAGRTGPCRCVRPGSALSDHQRIGMQSPQLCGSPPPGPLHSGGSLSWDPPGWWPCVGCPMGAERRGWGQRRWIGQGSDLVLGLG